MVRTILAALLTAASTIASAQEPLQPDSLFTRPGWEAGGQIAKYRYEEPDIMNLKGNRGGGVGAYTFTNAKRVFNRIDARASYGSLDYESQGTGTASDVGDQIVEVRAVIGKDFLTGDSIVLSPYVGLGYRYLYNDLRGYSSTGAIGYRRYSHYVYAPVGLTLRMHAGEGWVLAPTVEYDAFLGGRQRTKLSDTGLGFSDVTNDQDRGRGYRVYLMLETRRLAFGPWLHYWKIKDSDIQPIGFGFGALEPENWTREYGVEVRYRF